MEKVKVSKEVFDALERFKLRRGEDFKLHLNYCVITGSLREDEKALCSRVKLSELVDIAYCGYELEETKEEKLIRIYNKHSLDKNVQLGIELAINILELNIDLNK